MRHREGYWYEGTPDEGKIYLPKPVPNEKPWKGQRAFLTALAKVEGNATDGDREITTSRHFKGCSPCRCCDNERNGSGEFICTALKSEWVWPSGFRHYIEVHNVRPSVAFQEFIIAVAAKKLKSSK